MAYNWSHLIRFIAKEDGQVHLGQVDVKMFPDVGLSTFEGKDVTVQEISGDLFSGRVTAKSLSVERVRCLEADPLHVVANAPLQLLSPIAMSDVPLVRCLGLNYKDHAREANMAIPDDPVLFIKPRTAVNGPFPAKIGIPKIAQDGTSDYEAELTFIIGKSGRDIDEANAMDHVLGYTCSNDVSARTQQFKNSQWCFSKGKSAASFWQVNIRKLIHGGRVRWFMPVGAGAGISLCGSGSSQLEDQGYPQWQRCARFFHKVRFLQ